MAEYTRAITCPNCAGRGWYRVPVHEGIPVHDLPKYLHRYCQVGVLSPNGWRVRDAEKAAKAIKRPDWLRELVAIEAANLNRPLVVGYLLTRIQELTA